MPASTAPGSRAPSGALPSQPQSLQHRLQAVVQHQQFFWWVGHVIIVLATFIHAIYWCRFNYNSKMAVFWYRLALLGAIGSYGVVVYKMFFRVISLSPPRMTGVDCRVDWQMRENRKDCFIDFTSMRMLNILVTHTHVRGL